MVGDIISDPLDALIGGTLAGAGWVLNQVWQTQYDTWVNTQNATQQWTSGFTTDDLVDIPPPPAEDLGSVTPDAPPAEGGQSSSGSSGKTFEEYATELVQNEAKSGIQSPLGPEDPTAVLVPVADETPNKDPQAPLKPGFTQSPEPAVRKTAGANLVMSRIGSAATEINPGGSSFYVFYPTFRGQKGSSKSISVQTINFYAVPSYSNGVVNWKARVQALTGSKVRATWEFDAGSRAPSSGEFDFRFTATDSSFNNSLLTTLFRDLGDRVNTYPLQVSAAPPLVPESSLNQGLVTGGKNPYLAPYSPDQPSWTQVVDQPAEDSSVLPGEGFFPKVPFPSFPAKAPVPPTAVPINPNNPTANPAIGTNGVPLQNVANIVQTGTDVHKIGDLTVNSGKIRATTTSIAKEVGRIEQKSAALQKGQNSLWDNIGNLADLLLLLELLRQLLEDPLPAKRLTLNPVCEDEAEPTVVVLPPEKYMSRIQSSLDALPVLLQAHLGYKTPTCGNEKPELEGQWVTTRWISDEKMVDSSRRLRKLFRYRTKSTRDLGQLSAYWASFTWKSGPVCVIHKGAWWGTPQIWAESAEEGQRVIRHAAAEAGIDPDQIGRWTISSSGSPRYGMSGTMKILKKEGFPWVASRDGAQWPNYLALSRDP